MNTADLYRVIKRPHISEKTAMQSAESNQYVFEVQRSAGKRDVKAAVEKLFDVKVESVTTVSVPSKPKGFRMTSGRRAGWKKAYVRLRQGQTIDLVEGESA